jgi:shikimate dehydrogenase
MPWLTEADPIVTAIQACNCIRVRNSGLYGYNTDVTGFERSFVRQLSPRHTNALILGTGGASAAVAFALDRLGIGYRFVSRSRQPGGLLYEELDRELLGLYKVIINASPAGTLAHPQEAPAIPYEFLTPEHYLFDLVYNPPETIFLKKGKEKGASICNGHEMLVLQAEENWKIWNR